MSSCSARQSTTAHGTASGSSRKQPDVSQAPAPVIAKALGYHDKTATRLVTEAGGTWSRYAWETTNGDRRRPETQATDALKGSVGMISASSKSCSNASWP
ncbi:hypothetical protein GCM10010234_74180 [Streptomyces hawaiiensis]